MKKQPPACTTCHCHPCICQQNPPDRILRIMERAIRIAGIDQPHSQTAAQYALDHLLHNGYVVGFPSPETTQ